MEIAGKMAALIGKENIHLSTPVISIDDQTSKVIIKAKSGTEFHARKCIISIPSTMYRELKFTPPLPPPVQEITNATRLGHYNKAIVCYNIPWWKDLGYNGFFFSYKGPVSIARDSSVPEKGLYALTCFVNGRAGEEWSKLDVHARRRAVLQQLAAVYNVDPDSELWRPIEFFDQIWQHEEFSRGALAPIPALGHYTRFAEVYGKPVGNLSFVGTEYSDHWKGYMEGALTSGDRGAKGVVEALGRRRANL